MSIIRKAMDRYGLTGPPSKAQRDTMSDAEGTSTFIKGFYWEPQIGNPKNIPGI